MTSAEELDLVETQDLVDAVARRYNTFILVAHFTRGDGKKNRDVWWGGDARAALRIAIIAQGHLEAVLDQRDHG